MINIDLITELPADIIKLIAIAVLIDGKEAEEFLNLNPEVNKYKKIINELALLSPEIRIPFLGSLIRFSSLKDRK